MYFTGIDMGSTCTKLIVLDEGGAIAYKKVVPTGWNCVETAKGLIDELAEDGFARESMLIVSTGYGRQAIPFADKKVTEISCHGKGAYYLFNDDAFTLIDIGGQDTKIIETERGTVRNFIMNDKCSAGTGRFLEIMAGGAWRWAQRNVRTGAGEQEPCKHIQHVHRVCGIGSGKPYRPRNGQGGHCIRHS